MRKDSIQCLLNPLFFTLLVSVGCSRQVSEPTEIVVIAEGVQYIEVLLDSEYIEAPFDASLFSLIQMMSTDIFITSAGAYEGYVLHAFNLDQPLDIKTVIRHGRGPIETTSISSSSKTIQSDSLIFLSREQAKLLIVTSVGQVSDFEIDSEIYNQIRGAFSMQSGFIAFETNSHLHPKSLIAVLNVNSGAISYGIPPRVPYGYQPAVRNIISHMCPIPEGFALVFVGDRKLYLIDRAANVQRVLALGESDPIGTPFRVSNPSEAPGAYPRIPKMQYHNGLLHVLMDDSLYLLDLESQRVKTVIHFVNREDERMTPLEFSASGDHMIVRIGRNRFYPVQLEPDWY